MPAGAQGVAAEAAARVTSRKFMLALLIQGTACAALFVGKLDGGTYVAVATLTLSIYGASSIYDKKLNPAQQP